MEGGFSRGNEEAINQLFRTLDSFQRHPGTQEQLDAVFRQATQIEVVLQRWRQEQNTSEDAVMLQQDVKVTSFLPRLPSAGSGFCSNVLHMLLLRAKLQRGEVEHILKAYLQARAEMHEDGHLDNTPEEQLAGLQSLTRAMDWLHAILPQLQCLSNVRPKKRLCFEPRSRLDQRIVQISREKNVAGKASHCRGELGTPSFERERGEARVDSRTSPGRRIPECDKDVAHIHSNPALLDCRGHPAGMARLLEPDTSDMQPGLGLVWRCLTSGNNIMTAALALELLQNESCTRGSTILLSSKYLPESVLDTAQLTKLLAMSVVLLQPMVRDNLAHALPATQFVKHPALVHSSWPQLVQHVEARMLSLLKQQQRQQQQGGLAEWCTCLGEGLVAAVCWANYGAFSLFLNCITVEGAAAEITLFGQRVLGWLEGCCAGAQGRLVRMALLQLSRRQGR